jgi:hypothetical protein
MESDDTEDDEYVCEESNSIYSSDDEMDYEYDEGDVDDEGIEDDEVNEEQIGQETGVGA